MLRAGALIVVAALMCSAAANGAYPGRNGRIAYVESARGRANAGWGLTIVTVHPDGTGRRALTKPTRTSGDFDPAWSPDGRRIAYVHSTGSTVGPGQVGTEIWVMDADGSGKRRLTWNVSFDGGPTWSPDGRRIMFVRGSLYTNGSGLPHSDLWIMNANGSGQRRLTRTRELELEPSWSPRGDRIAFLVAPPVRVCTASNACTLGRDRDLWTSAPDGTRRATGGIGGDLLPSGPAWSPDGQRLAAGTRLGIVSISVDGKDARVVGGGDEPAWSPDGTALVVSDQFGATNFLGLTLLATGGRTTPITHNPAPTAELLIDQHQPDWQPLR
jgi:Tol biopolymer transport system component